LVWPSLIDAPSVALGVILGFAFSGGAFAAGVVLYVLFGFDPLAPIPPR
jgi:hypothetical protein